MILYSLAFPGFQFHCLLVILLPPGAVMRETDSVCGKICDERTRECVRTEQLLRLIMLTLQLFNKSLN